MVTPQDAKKCNVGKQTGHSNDYSIIYNHKACWIMQISTFHPKWYVFHHSVNIFVCLKCVIIGKIRLKLRQNEKKDKIVSELQCR